ncbi:MAG: hypothetical protein ACK40X_11620, partial [Armatimonadota bacterium]
KRQKVGSTAPILAMVEGLPVSTTIYATRPNMKPSGGEEFPIKLSTTDFGLAHLSLDQPGIWLIACQQGNARATLTFSVPKEDEGAR